MRNLKYLLASVAIGSFMFLPLIAGPTKATRVASGRDLVMLRLRIEAAFVVIFIVIALSAIAYYFPN